MANFQERCSKFFDEADTDKTGSLSKLELYRVLQKSGVKADGVLKSFNDMDSNKDGSVTKAEFMAELSKIHPKDVLESDLRTEFSKWDPDGSGYITLDEMKQVMAKRGLNPEHASLGDMDVNEDNKVNFEEFLKVFRNK